MSLKDSCRICLQIKPSMVLMNLLNIKNRPVISIVEELFNVEIDNSKDLPNKICVNCIKAIKAAQDLKSLVWSSQQHLEGWLAKDTTNVAPTQPINNDTSSTCVKMKQKAEILQNPSGDLTKNATSKEKKSFQEQNSDVIKKEPLDDQYDTRMEIKQEDPLEITCEIPATRIIPSTPQTSQNTCAHCMTRFNTSAALLGHLKQIDTYTCPYCSNTFTTCTVVKNQHETNCEKQQHFVCEYTFCRKSCGSKYSLTQHLRWHKEGYVCQMCNERFDYKVMLHEHIKTVHQEKLDEVIKLKLPTKFTKTK